MGAVLRWWAVRCSKCQWGNDRRAATREGATRRSCPKCNAPVVAAPTIRGPGSTASLRSGEL